MVRLSLIFCLIILPGILLGVDVKIENKNGTSEVVLELSTISSSRRGVRSLRREIARNQDIQKGIKALERQYARMVRAEASEKKYEDRLTAVREAYEERVCTCVFANSDLIGFHSACICDRSHRCCAIQDIPQTTLGVELYWAKRFYDDEKKKAEQEKEELDKRKENLKLIAGAVIVSFAQEKFQSRSSSDCSFVSA